MTFLAATLLASYILPFLYGSMTLNRFTNLSGDPDWLSRQLGETDWERMWEVDRQNAKCHAR